MEETQVQGTTVGAENPPTEVKTFTQEQVNGFMQERINSIYKGYGVNNKEELDALIQKASGYDELKTNFDNLQTNFDTTNTNYQEMINAHKTVSEELAFVKNDIKPERYDDIRAYFKGKDIEFTAENLIKELETHKEWLNEKPTVKIGYTKSEEPQKNEWEEAKKIFGI